MALQLRDTDLLAAIFSPRTAKEFAPNNRLPAPVAFAASPQEAAAAANTVLVSVPIH